ncbi:predicted protein [Naegleria gruberi]|uniref:Predicted protein n=1 Tax=Naegleria gruberi TaxID=5762 RepID=D2VWZ2_NAEGR|nr:uncharacterized protein NAEGRDRAFT_73556 [Naegleria gruberi]EFC38775.1 predicted protein [Naegleria gruberi]|eukprot:XP_002671519.1 predicted protein [Naegleria gruberi strain NEG-M]
MTKFLILLLFISCFIIANCLVDCQLPQISIPTPQQSGDTVQQEQLPQVSIPTPQQSGDTVQQEQLPQISIPTPQQSGDTVQPPFKVFGSHHIIRPIISHFKPHHSQHHTILPHLRGSPHPSQT